jgi:hypothetical protein
MLLTMKGRQRVEAIEALTGSGLDIVQTAHVLRFSERQGLAAARPR